jgi:hypothetical protein
LAKTACGSRPANKPSRVSFLIAISALHRRHYGPAHKIPDSPALGNEAKCVTRVENRLLGLTVVPHKPTTLSERVGDVLKTGADQCSRINPAVVWLHFVGMSEAVFVELARHSSDGRGRGLNVVVANAFHPDASSTNRTHVQRVRFSGDPDGLSRHLAFRPDRLLAPSVSAGGQLYDVPNPYARFAVTDDL